MLNVKTMLERSLDGVIVSLYIFTSKVLFSGVRASITVVHTRKFDKIYTNIVRFRLTEQKLLMHA